MYQLANEGTTHNKPTPHPTYTSHTPYLIGSTKSQQANIMEKSTTSNHTNTIMNRNRKLHNQNSHTSTNRCLMIKSKNIKLLMESLKHMRYINYTNHKIPIRPIHGKPPKEHLMATNISQPQLHTLPKPQN